MKEEEIDERMVLGLIESVLGKGHTTARSNAAFICPFCHWHNPKLEIQLHTNDKKENKWHCWHCGEKGKTLSSLFQKTKVPQQKIKELDLLIKPGKKTVENVVVEGLSLPEGFIPLSNTPSLDIISSIEAKHAIKYLKSRNISEDDIFKYGIGFSVEGVYSRRIIVPSYDAEGQLNYFSSRTYLEDEPQKYKNPPVGRNIIGFEYYINWDLPIILVEGIFDALTIKRNVIPLFGKDISEELMKKIVGSQVSKVYIALDNDAQKEALRHCEKLMSFGKEVYLIQLDGKDASSIGFSHFLDIIEQTTPLTFSSLLKLKLK